MKLIKDLPRQEPVGALAQVSYSDDTGFDVVGDSEISGALVLAPRGVAYRPCVGDHLLLQPVQGANACVGAVVSTQGLKPGELQLTSSGGATILLKQNGEIHLNGLIINKKGEIISP